MSSLYAHIRCRFVSFVAGAFTAVLVLVSVIDPDLVLRFEISPHRNVAFYLAVFGGILTVARGMIPEENRVFDPELLMTEVITYTHYMPEEWKAQLHSRGVGFFSLPFFHDTKSEFCFLGTSRIWRVIRDESVDIHTRARISCTYTIRAMVLSTGLCTSHYRFLPRIFSACGWSRLYLQFRRI